MVTFEVGKEYYQVFSNGERCYVRLTERHKNGNWKGITWAAYANGRKGKEKQTSVQHPPHQYWIDI